MTPGILIKNGEVLRFLALLDEAEFKGKKILLSDDLLFLSKTAKFGLELLIRQRFFPSLKWQRTENKRKSKGEENLVCFWRPLFVTDDEKRLFSQLKDSVPDSARCATLTQIQSREIFLLHFLTSIIDSTVKKSSNYELREFFGWNNYSRDKSDKNGFILEIPRKEKLFAQFEEWSSPLAVRHQVGDFRTCFRLEPPKNDGGNWLLNFLIQSIEDPSLIIEAKDLWDERKRAIKAKITQDLLTRFLSDLGVAMRLFPQIEEALSVPKPTQLNLTTHGAYSFLQDTSLLLRECGFGIFVPSFWDMERRQGIQPRVAVKATASYAGAGLGLSNLVKFDWKIAVEDKTISKKEFEELVRLKIPLVNIRGQWVEIQPQWGEKLLKYLNRKEGMPLFELIRLSLGNGDEQGIFFSDIEAEGWLKDLLESLKGNSKIEELHQPEDFVGELRPYQIRGFSWMNYMNRFGLGVCLADDMGLGKTIQFIALLLHRKKEGLKEPSLLVCPTSVIGNWERELKRFSPNLRVMIHHGTTRLLGKDFEREAKTKDVIVTSYSLLYRDRETFKDINFGYIVLDEAQNIKNPNTKQAQSARSLKAGLKIALTGTPIENRLSELWSIMEFLNPGYLMPITKFKREFGIPIERYNNEEVALRLKNLIGPFILRRLKTDPTIIADLPTKMEVKTFCPLTTEQATLYQATVDEMMESIEKAEGINRKGEVLALLMKLKQICNHPALFLHDRSKIEGRSGKLKRLIEMLEEVLGEKDRALIFTQFAEMGNLLKEYLENTFLSEVLFLHGGVSRKNREEMISRFQSEDGPSIFVLSLKAGGLGLNLTRANRVFHFDRWWNPAVENQATDRVFRIGQSKNVIVHKFICQGTVEERIDEMLERKKELADRIVGAGENWITELSTEQLRNLFTLQKEAVME